MINGSTEGPDRISLIGERARREILQLLDAVSKSGLFVSHDLDLVVGVPLGGVLKR